MREYYQGYYNGYYQDKIGQLSSSNEQLTSKVNYLEKLLTQHNIQFD